MGLLNKLGSMLRRKEDPDEKLARQREKRLVNNFGLEKDPQVKGRFWLDDEHFVRINTRDNDSYLAGEKVLQDFDRSPRLKRATKEQRSRVYAPGKQSQGSGLLDDLAGMGNRAGGMLGGSMGDINPGGYDPIGNFGGGSGGGYDPLNLGDSRQTRSRGRKKRRY